MKRITELDAPPVVSHHYLVPTITRPWRWFGLRAWPVFLPLHDDARFFNFPDRHYHIDPRFLHARVWQSLEGAQPYGALGWLQKSPISRMRDEAIEGFELPPIERRTMACKRTQVPYRFHDRPRVVGLLRHYAGVTCARNRHGWMCPHQHVSLASFEPDAHGVITCPLHGLRIRAADGICLEAP